MKLQPSIIQRAGSTNNNINVSATSYEVDEVDEAYHPPPSNSSLVDCSIDDEHVWNNDIITLPPPAVVQPPSLHPNNNNTTTTTMKNGINLANSKRISLWLLPPKPLMATLTTIQLELISKHHPYRQNHQQQHQQQQQQQQLLPTFTPHVTLIGGVSISELLTDVELSRLGLNNNDPVDESDNNDGDGDDSNGDNGDGDDDDELHEAAARIVLERLKRAFRSFGGIECNCIEERDVFAAHNISSSLSDNNNNNNNHTAGLAVGGEGCEEGTIVKWNQSCVCIMERSVSFVRAMHVAEEALFNSTANSSINSNNGASTSATTTPPAMPNIERHFKPPLHEPHYSFVYGNACIPSTLECPPDFVSSEMSVMWTHPSSLEGVQRWREIGNFSLI